MATMTMMTKAAAGRRYLPARVRQVLLTAHIMMSVGLLGDSAGFLAVALRAARLDDPAARLQHVQILNLFSLAFGIPLSIGALLTGLALGLGTRWGVLRYPWVATKLLLVLSVMLVGATVIGPAENTILTGAGDAPATSRLIAAAAYDVLALALATTLSVFKPGRPFRREAAPAG